ncbi:MAG TPA: WcaI family glycosyltransferase [Aequorivita sp.]|nr:WcaI family glycosyltransferase [Aequorivita sp.]
MKKRILLIGYNFNPEPTGIGKYNGEMISWFGEKGYDCTVITTYPYYPYWKVQEPYFKDRFWYKTERQELSSGGRIKIHRCPIYVPQTPSGITRMLLDVSFLISATLKMVQLIPGKKYDYVITVVPSFQFGLLGIFYRLFRRSKFLYHIQDLQIEAARDLKLIKSKTIIRGLLKIEQIILKKADYVSTISEGMAAKIRKKSDRKIYLLANWVNVKLFQPLQEKSILKGEFGFMPEDKVVLYSGAMGEKQGLDMIIYAAKALRENAYLKFLICGSGPYSKKLISLTNQLNLKNVHFLPLQPLTEFNRILNMADVHLVIQKSQANGLVMPSKLTTILAVGGLALVTANEGSELHRLIHAHEIGLVIDADNQEALNDGIKKAIGGDWKTITSKARQYAENHLSIDNILLSYEKHVLNEDPISFGKPPHSNTKFSGDYTPMGEGEQAKPFDN